MTTKWFLESGFAGKFIHWDDVRYSDLYFSAVFGWRHLQCSSGIFTQWVVRYGGAVFCAFYASCFFNQICVYSSDPRLKRQ